MVELTIPKIDDSEDMFDAICKRMAVFLQTSKPEELESALEEVCLPYKGTRTFILKLHDGLRQKTMRATLTHVTNMNKSYFVNLTIGYHNEDIEIAGPVPNVFK